MERRGEWGEGRGEKRKRRLGEREMEKEGNRESRVRTKGREEKGERGE
jgi:hypothetical protein